MKQFPSVSERRVHVFGNGIVANTPRPSGVTLQADPETWLPGLPYQNRIKQAAMIAKFGLHSQAYSAIAGRYTGEDAFNIENIPHEYSEAAMAESLYYLWASYLATEDRAFSWIYYAVGDEIPEGSFPYLPHTINVARPDWGKNQLLDAIRYGITASQHWDDLSAGSFAGVLIDRGPWHARYDGQDPADPDLTWPEQNRHYNGEARKNGVLMPQLLMIRQILIWGECEAPTQVGGEARACPVLDAGTNSGEWLEWLRQTAARVLYQMAWLECMMQEDNTCNFEPGGHGGTVGQGTERNPHALKPGSIRPNSPILTPDREITRGFINGMLDLGEFIEKLAEAIFLH
jgi:hypothetical protein